MEYKIDEIEKIFNGEILESSGNVDYLIKINGKEHQLKILSLDSKGIEFLLDQQYHKTKYLENTTNSMNIVIDNVPISIKMHTNLDDIVYKNSGGTSTAGGELTLKSQIPGKVITISVSEGDLVNQGDTVCVLESMKMQVSVKSHKSGTVKSIKIKQGSSVAKGDPIAEIE